MSIADELAKLESLRTQGVLTQEEFDRQKAALLAGRPSLRPQVFTPELEAAPPMPPTHLAEAILATLLCCLPFGIVAIVKASNVSGAYHAGRYDEATPETTQYYQSLTPGSALAIFDNSSHMAMLEETDRYLQVVRDFLHRVEGK